MKLRCSNNSIRLRVRKSETAELKTGATLVENVQIGPSKFSFGLKQGSSETIKAVFESGQIMIEVPEPTMTNWLDTEEVGIKTEQPLDTGETLSILIEKDFPCTTRKTENKADTFQDLASNSDNVC